MTLLFVRIRNNLSLCLFPIISSWKYNNLLKGFISREIKGRFAGTFAGILWTLINPIATIAVYVFLFSIVIRIPVTAQESGTDSFAIFLLSGLFPWLIFAESLSRAVGSLLGNSDLITKVVFPIELLPTSSVVSAIIINGIGLILFLAYLLLIGHLDITWIWFLPLIVFEVLFTWGLSMLLSALSVFIRDIQELLGIIIMVWFYGTPIIYPVSLVPESMHIFFQFNPMALMVLLYRQVFLVHSINLHWMAIVGIISLIVYILGSWFFMRAKSAFGDIL